MLLQCTTAGFARLLSRGLLYFSDSAHFGIFSLFLVSPFPSNLPPPIPLASFRDSLRIAILYFRERLGLYLNIYHRRSVVLSFGETSVFSSTSHNRFLLPPLRSGRCPGVLPHSHLEQYTNITAWFSLPRSSVYRTRPICFLLLVHMHDLLNIPSGSI